MLFSSALVAITAYWSVAEVLNNLNCRVALGHPLLFSKPCRSHIPKQDGNLIRKKTINLTLK